MNGILNSANTKEVLLEEDINNITIGFDDPIISCQNMFKDLDNIIEIDLSNFDTSKVINMAYMFLNCIRLEKINLWNINTTLVTSMSGMFKNCRSLISIDLSYFDTSKVTTMTEMFSYCEKIKSIDASSFNTSNVENMGDLFGYCTNLLAVDISNFETSKAKIIRGMFIYCNNLKYVNLKNFSGLSVADINFIFSGCKLIYLNLMNFKINNIMTIDPKPFNGAPIIKYFCLEDQETLEYFKTDAILKYEILNCSNKCFQENIKISTNDECVEECSTFEYNNLCYDTCPIGTYKLYKDKYICSDIIPENYYYDSQNELYKECYQTCKKCHKPGNDINNNCDQCKQNFIFLNESFIDNSNCFKKCDLYYFDENNKYICVDSCPNEYSKIVVPKKKCIDDCKKDDIYTYEYNSNNNTCLGDCPIGTFRVYNKRNICSDIIQENYYLDKEDEIYKPCHENCKKCFGKGIETNNNCSKCHPNFILINEPNKVNNCFQCTYFYYFDDLNNNYLCTDNFSCPINYNIYIPEKQKCIKKCFDDNIYKFQYNNTCYEQCPNGTYSSNNLILQIILFVMRLMNLKKVLQIMKYSTSKKN